MIGRFPPLCATLALCGCGLNLTAGPSWVGGRDRALQTSATIATHAQRKSSPVGGVRLNAAMDDGLVLKSAALHGGYDFILVPGWWTIEPGADFGAGQPVTHTYEGTGAYAGGTFLTRLRLTPGDREPGFNIGYLVVELSAGAHLGTWMPPEHSTSARVYVDRGFDFGIRVGLGSDLFSANQGGIWRGEPKRPSPAPVAPGASE